MGPLLPSCVSMQISSQYRDLSFWVVNAHFGAFHVQEVIFLDHVASQFQRVPGPILFYYSPL